MYQRFWTKLFAMAVIALLPAASWAATHTVTQMGMTFSPSAITVAPGDTVHWVWTSGTHTVTSGTPCTPDGIYFNAPLDSTHLTFDYVIPASATSIPYFCIFHCAFGMTGMITVQTPTGACCIATSCEGDMSEAACTAIGGTWNAGQACGVFICPGTEIRCTPGDINGDGMVNSFDIDPFVAVLVGQDTDPSDMCSADTNGDGLVNSFDIDPFVLILTSGGTSLVGYQHDCDGNNYGWSVNTPVGRCYLVSATKGGEASDCQVTVEAHDNTHTVVGVPLTVLPGGQAEFCMPAGATHIVYRCQSTPTHTCRFSWQVQ